MDSSTQIARELGFQPAAGQDLREMHSAVEAPGPATNSFSSGSFDLTEEDLEELDPTPRATSATTEEAARANEKARIPPPPSFTTATTMLPGAEGATKAGAPMLSDYFHAAESSDMDFTMTELESFMDDDLQLTQIAPS